MRSARHFVLASFVCALAGCTSGGDSSDAGALPDGADGGRTTVGFHDTHHEFPAIHATSGENVTGTCQSWTLHNDETIYVNAVEMNAEHGWHHSNWVFVPDNVYGDPSGSDDGSWDCSSRSFNEVAAATQGSVFFAQSTQATHEIQQFQPGVVITIPPHSRIIGAVHIVNTGTAAIDTKLTFDLTLIPESHVTVRLSPISMTFEDGLIVPASQTSDSTLTCDIAGSYSVNLRRAPDFKIYYVLPHYHQLGVGMTVEAMRADGTVMGTIFDNAAAIGDPLGKMLDTPFDMTGASGIRFTCHYDNGTSSNFHFQNSLAGEMCVFLAYTDSPLTIGAFSNAGGHDATSTPEPDGTPRFTAPCSVIGLPTVTL